METVPRYFKVRDRLSQARLSSHSTPDQPRNQVNCRLANWPSGNDTALAHLVGRELAIQMIPDLPIPHCPYRRQPGVQVTSGAQCSDLVDEPLFQHLRES